MKLQHLIVIFIIIMLPIMLILSQYIDTQLDIINLRNTYTTALINSVSDAMRAYEINTMNNDYSDVATSKRRDVQASINTFFKSLAGNMGLSGYREQELTPYIPAVIFTNYDGYYIYAKSKNGGASTPEYKLKPYVYYSAQYINGSIDVTINYTLDNYLTVVGYDDNGNYIQESGYFISDVEKNFLSGLSSEVLKEKVTCKVKQPSGEVAFEPAEECSYFYEYTPSNKSFGKVYMDNNRQYFRITAAGYKEDVNESSIFDVYDFPNLPDTYGSTNPIYRIINISSVYKENDLLSDNAISLLEKLKVEDLVVNSETGRTRLKDLRDPTNPYYNLQSENKIFDMSDPNLIIFNNHKEDIIKISIQENLKVALANYGLNGEITYKLPIFTEEDWQKIFSNVSMIAFMQDLPVSYGTYNDYAIATSIGNKEYVPEDGIYFIDTDTNIYHRITCSKIKDKTSGLIGYKAVEFERNSISIDGNGTHYYYPHNATACYECIVSSNYESIRDKNGSLNQNLQDNNYLKTVFYNAVSRERVTQYKSTSFLATY